MTDSSITPSELMMKYGHEQKMLGMFCFSGTPAQMKEWGRQAMDLATEIGLEQATVAEKLDLFAGVMERITKEGR